MQDEHRKNDKKLNSSEEDIINDIEVIQGVLEINNAEDASKDAFSESGNSRDLINKLPNNELSGFSAGKKSELDEAVIIENSGVQGEDSSNSSSCSNKEILAGITPELCEVLTDTGFRDINIHEDINVVESVKVTEPEEENKENKPIEESKENASIKENELIKENKENESTIENKENSPIEKNKEIESIKEKEKEKNEIVEEKKANELIKEKEVNESAEEKDIKTEVIINNQEISTNKEPQYEQIIEIHNIGVISQPCVHESKETKDIITNNDKKMKSENSEILIIKQEPQSESVPNPLIPTKENKEKSFETKDQYKEEQKTLTRDETPNNIKAGVGHPIRNSLTDLQRDAKSKKKTPRDSKSDTGCNKCLLF